MKRNKRGISLIALIITIIVIIILAAIVITMSLKTPEQAKYAKFCNDVSSIQEAVTVKFSEIYGNKVASGKNVTRKQVFNELTKADGAALTGTGVKEIDPAKLGYELPEYVDSTGTAQKWYLDTETGDVYLIPGYEYDDKRYLTVTESDANIGEVEEALDFEKFHEVITVNLTNGLIPVIYNESQGKWQVADKTNNSEEKWYDYRVGTNRWANAVTVKSGVNTSVGSLIEEEDLLGMFVYIPRYAYRIKSGLYSSTTGEIDIAFIDLNNKDSEDKTYSVAYPTVTGNVMDDFVVHPAFVDGDVVGYNNGEWDEEIEGFWVAKFEASSSATELVPDTGAYTVVKATGEGIPTTVTATAAEGAAIGKISYNSVNNDYGGGNTIGSQFVTVRPNVTSWRYINVNNIVTASTNMASAHGISGDSHMMKNSEWGAVAYLTQSEYGANGQIWNNSYTEGEIYHEAGDLYTMTNLSKTITGMVAKEGMNTVTSYYSEKVAKTYNTDGSVTIKYRNITTGGGTGTEFSRTYYTYNTEYGVKGSTTGNIYGIYDMSGGAWEYTAAYIDNSHANLDNGSNLRAKANKYKTVYTSAKASESGETVTNAMSKDNYNTTKAEGRYGDAVFETSIAGAGTTSWNSDYSNFPSANNPFVIRGGVFDNASGAGVFAFNRPYGGPSYYYGFRPCLVVSGS